MDSNQKPGETAALELAQRQATDEGLWFAATTASEAYLQQELRRLHAAIEGEPIAFRKEMTPPASASNLVDPWPIGWIRGVCSHVPGEPDEWDVEFSYGDDRPEGSGWRPVYSTRHYDDLKAERDRLRTGLTGMIEAVRAATIERRDWYRNVVTPLQNAYKALGIPGVELSPEEITALSGEPPSSDETEEKCCRAERGGGFVCTLPLGHAGRHEAWGSPVSRPKYLIEHWPSPEKASEP